MEKHPRQGIEALYDLRGDPGEKVNLAGDPACAPLGDELRARLKQWMVETGDPLLNGPVLSPFGRRALETL